MAEVVQQCDIWIVFLHLPYWHDMLYLNNFSL